MKKLIKILLPLLAVVMLLAACAEQAAVQNLVDKPRFIGAVTKTHENYITVNVIESDRGLATGSLVNVALNTKLKTGVSFNIHDEVIVFYDGIVSRTNPGQIRNVHSIILIPRSLDDVQRLTDAYVPAIETANNSKTVMNLSNKNASSITESGSFKVEGNQTLTLKITSNIQGGSADLFLFDPNGKEQRISIGSENITREIQLTEGSWAFNCTGFFKSGNIQILGTLT